MIIISQCWAHADVMKSFAERWIHQIKVCRLSFFFFFYVRSLITSFKFLLSLPSPLPGKKKKLAFFICLPSILILTPAHWGFDWEKFIDCACYPFSQANINSPPQTRKENQQSSFCNLASSRASYSMAALIRSARPKLPYLLVSSRGIATLSPLSTSRQR